MARRVAEAGFQHEAVVKFMIILDQDNLLGALHRQDAVLKA